MFSVRGGGVDGGTGSDVSTNQTGRVEPILFHTFLHSRAPRHFSAPHAVTYTRLCQEVEEERVRTRHTPQSPTMLKDHPWKARRRDATDDTTGLAKSLRTGRDALEVPRSEHKARLFCGLINDLDGHLKPRAQRSRRRPECLARSPSRHRPPLALLTPTRVSPAT